MHYLFLSIVLINSSFALLSPLSIYHPNPFHCEVKGFDRKHSLCDGDMFQQMSTISPDR